MRELSKDLREFIRLVNKNEVRYLIVGAWALAHYAKPRYTADLDVFISRDKANAAKMLAALHDFGFADVGITEGDLLQSDRVIQLGYEPNRIDILTGITGVKFKDAWGKKVQGTISGERTYFIGREDLIVNKRATGREQDIVDANLLENIAAQKTVKH